MKAEIRNNGKQTTKLFSGNKKLLFLGVGFISILVIVGIGFLVYYFLIRKEPYQPCTDNYQHLAATGFCYKTYVLLVTREAALDHCDLEGGGLASINSDIENDFIIYLYNWTLAKNQVDGFSGNSEVWIDFLYDIYEKVYASDDGTNNGYNFFIYERGVTQHGPFFVILPNNRGAWQSRNDSTLASYTCKRLSGAIPRPFKRDCSPGFTLFRSTGFCYKAFLERLTFHEASRKCSSEGAHLISLHSYPEWRGMISLYKKRLMEVYKFAGAPFSPLWTGLTYNGSSWSWSDGSKIDDFIYDEAFWKTPPSPGHNWTAIILEETTADDRIVKDWITVGDPNYFSFVCKKPDTSVTPSDTPTLPESSTTTTPSTDIIQNSKNCSKGYKLFEMTGYCYKFIDKLVNFTIANNNCQKEKGQLASIHSEEENQFILDLAKELFGTHEEFYDEFYIGLIYQNDRWEWTDGSPVNYVNWKTIEPNLLKTEKCSSIVYGVRKDQSVFSGWNNVKDSLEQSYYCKKTAG